MAILPVGLASRSEIVAVADDLAEHVAEANPHAGTQPLDDDLTALAALAPADDSFIQRKSGVWVGRTVGEVKTDLALVKADVGLGNVDNTSDANKPVSTATQTALNLKANLAGGTFSGDVSVPDEAYDATAWNDSLEVPTKNALRDKIETLAASGLGMVLVLSTDNEAAIQTKLSAAGGKRVVFEPATYTVTTPLLPVTGTTIDLTGATIKHVNDTTGNAIFTLSGVNSVDILGGTLDGNVAGQSVWSEQRHCIRVLDCDRIRILDVDFINLTGDGVYISHVTGAIAPFTGSSRVLIEGCAVIGSGLNRNGVSIVCGARIKILDNFFYRMAGPASMPGAIDMEPNTADDFIRNVIIRGNTIEGGATLPAIAGISLNNNNGAPIEDILIESNEIFGGVTRGVFLSGNASVTERRIVVRGNIIRDILISSSNYGIAAENISALIDGNDIDNIGFTAATSGYGIHQTDSDLEVRGGRISRCYIWGVAQNTAADTGRYRGIGFTDCGNNGSASRGAIILAGSDAQLVDLDIYSSASTITQRGVSIPSTAGTKNVIDRVVCRGSFGNGAFVLAKAPQIWGAGNVMPQTNPGSMTGTYPPATDSWPAGVRIYQFQPAASGFEGWISTTAGTPGTWKTFGAISA